MRTATWMLLIGMGMVLAPVQAGAQNLERLEQGLDRLTAPAVPSDDALPEPDDSQRPTLGLSAKVDGEPGGGVLIDSIVPGGPAARGGLRAGDLITKANGKVVNSANDLADILGGSKVGDRVSLTIRSAGRDRTVELTFAPRGASAAANAPAPMPPAGDAGLPLLPPESPASERPKLPQLSPPPRDPAMSRDPAPGREPALETPELGGRPSLGASVTPLTEEMAARYGAPTRRGAFIARITPEGPADRAGIPVGAVVVDIDGVRIDTADQLVDAIRTSRVGQEVELSYYNGAKLTRKTVRLGSAGPAPAGIGEPSPRTNRIDLSPPAAENPLSLTPPAAAGDGGALAALRAEVEQLRSQLRELQERLDRLEKASPAAPGSAPAGGRDAPAGRFGADDDGPAPLPPRFSPPTP